LLSLIVLLLSVNFYWNIYNKTENDIAQIEQELIDIKKKELKSVTKIVFSSIESASAELTKKNQEKLKAKQEIVFALLEARYKEAMSSRNPTYSIKKIKQELIKEFNKLRFDETGYLWIHSYDPGNVDKPVMIMHPFFPNSNGKDISRFKYTTGSDKGEIIWATGIKDTVPFFVQMNRVVNKDGEGFVGYRWPKPGLSDYQPKSSFVKLFKPFGWVIGIGAYVDDIEPEIKKEAIKIIKKFRYGADKQDYFWIHSFHPEDSNKVEMIMHPIIEELEGSDMSFYRYPNGKYKGALVTPENSTDSTTFLVKMNHIVRNDLEGNLRYLWPRPTENGISEYKSKLSYFKLFEKWNWVIGTGVYLEDIDKVKNQKMESLHEQTSEFMFTTMVISLIALIISFVSFGISSKTLLKPLKLLGKRMKEYTQGDRTLSKLPESEDEIGELSLAFSELRKENIELLNTLQDQVDRRTEALEMEKNLNELKSAFINTISHEYRTPLTTISSAAILVEMMAKKHKGEDCEMDKFIKSINIGVSTLTHLVEDVVDYDSIQNSNYELTKVPIDLIVFSKDIIDELKLIDKDQHNIKLESDSESVNILSDPKLLRQILVQTIKNAIKYSPGQTDIILDISTQDSDLVLCIIDKGIGIDPKDIEQIYKPFFKDKNAIGIKSGNGLGMAIVKEYMDILGGTIDVESTLNQGTTFIYRIPIIK
jgi:signal transduction histidine kinase